MIRRVKIWFTNIQIRYKILVLMIFLVLIPLLVSTLSTSAIFRQIMVKKTVSHMHNSTELVNARVIYMLDSLESCANTLVININRLVGRDPYSNDPLTELKRHNIICNELTYATLIFKEVDNVTFLDTHGRIYTSDLLLENHYNENEPEAIIKKLWDTSGTAVWFPMQRQAYLSARTTEPVIVMGKKIINIDTGESMGVLLLSIKESALRSSYLGIGSGNGETFIVDGENQIVTSSNPEQVLTFVESDILRGLLEQGGDFADVRNIGGAQVLAIGKPLDMHGWKFVYLEKMTELANEIQSVLVSIGIIAVMSLLLAFYAAFKLSGVIVNPLSKLTSDMKLVQTGDLNVKCEVGSSDEIGILADGFNNMIGQISSLIESVRSEQMKMRQSELALMQAQIKPHFLYNTLDSIYILERMDKKEEVLKITMALANFYRIALSHGSELITVDAEINCVRDYLSIMKIRYRDVFVYEIEVDPAIGGYNILKLTVQPLVENAIYHGIKENATYGRLCIRGFETPDGIVIEVEDNGVGFAPEKLEELQTRGASADAGKNFGLSNVNERIKMFFGKQYGLVIESPPGKGSVVRVNLPKYQNNHKGWDGH